MSSPNTIQEDWQGFNDDGTLTGSTSKTSGVNNTNWTQLVDENFRIRFVIQNTGTKSIGNANFALYANYNGTGYQLVGASTTKVKLSNDSYSIADHAVTAQRIGDGTYESGDSEGWNDGTTDNFTGLVDVTTTREVEVEFSCQIVGADVANGNSVLFEVRFSDASQLNAYNTRPSITVSKPVTANCAVTQTLSGLAQALDAEHIRTLAATQTLSGLSQALDAEHIRKLAAIQLLSGLSQNAVTKHVSTGNAVQTLDSISQTANVTTETDNNAAVVQTLSGISQAADLIHYTEATVVQTLSGLTQTADLDVDVQANATQTLDGISQSADLQHVRVANTVQSLSGLTQSLDADVDVEANATQTLDGISQSLSATSSLANNADVVQTLSGLAQSADIDVDVEANTTQTLSGLAQSAVVENVFDRYWVGDTNNFWNEPNNWAKTSGGSGGAGVPTLDNDVFFDNQYTTANCTINVATANAKSITFVNGGNYNGILNANGNNVNIGKGGLDCTGGSLATLTMGTGTWTCAGDWDVQDIGTLNYNTSTLQMTGNGTNIYAPSPAAFANLTIKNNVTIPATSNIAYMGEGSLTIDEGYTLTLNQSMRKYRGTSSINGTLSIASGKLHYSDSSSTTSSCTIGTNGRITGAGTYEHYAHTIINNNTALNSFDVAQINFYYNATIRGIIGGSAGNTLFHNVSSSRTFVFSNDVIFPGDIEVRCSASGFYTVNLVSNDVNVDFYGDLYLNEVSGTINWNEPSTGILTFTGTSDQTVTDNGNVGPLGIVVVNKAAGRLTLGNNLTVSNFTFTDGDLDIAGYTLTSEAAVDINGGSTGGRFWNGVDEDMTNGKFIIGNASLSAGTIDGDGGQQLVINNLDFDLKNLSTLTATYCDIGKSDVTNGVGDATDITNTDLNNNTNWNFGRANISQVLSGISQAGTIAATIVSNADIVQTLSGLSQSLVADAIITIDTTQILSGIIQTADVDVDINVSAVQTLSGISQSLLSDAANVANIVQALSGINQSLVSKVDVIANTTQVLSGISQAADIDVQANTNIVQSLSGVSQSADLDVDVEINATQLLSGISQAADAIVSEANNAVVVQTLSGLTQSANAETEIQATVVQSLASLLQNTVAKVEVAGAAEQTLSGISQSGSIEGSVTRNLSAVQSLSGLAQAAVLKVEATSNVVQTLSGLTQSASATGFYVADIVQSLSGLTQNANVETEITADAVQTLSSISQNALVVHIRKTDIVQQLAGISQSIIVAPTAPSLKIIDFDNEIVQLVTQNATIKMVHTASTKIFRSQ